MHAPSGGIVAPLSRASPTVAAAGAELEPTSARATSIPGKTTASGASTRPMPTRSIRRPSIGCIAATPSAYAPSAIPASAYERPPARSSRMMPSGTIPIGSEPSERASSRGIAPGTVTTARRRAIPRRLSAA